MPVTFFQILINDKILQHILATYLKKFMKTPPVAEELFHADSLLEGPTDITMLIVHFSFLLTRIKVFNEFY